METAKFHFVSPSISSTDKKASQLAQSEARAHAARVSHPRQQRAARPTTKSAPGDTQSDDLEQLSPESNTRDDKTPSGVKPKQARKPRHSKGMIFRVNVPKSKCHSPASTHTSPQARSDVTALSPSPKSPKDHSDTESRDSPSPISPNMFNPVQLFKSISKSTLDPFYRPAADLSVADSHLLHNYFTRVPNEIFGTTSSPLSKTISGGAYEGMATNEIQLMWCLIAMESQGISFQPTDHDRRMSILSRRSYIYNLMREQLSDENTARLTPFVLSVAGAAMIEKRLGNHEHARYHTRALKKLLDLWGGPKGLRDLQYPFGLMVFNALIEIGLPELYTYQGLLRKLPQMRKKLRELQTWNYNLVSRSSLKTTRGTNKSYLATILRPSDSLARRLQAFDKPSMKDYITYPKGDLTEDQYRFYLCMLYAINSALWAFREKQNASEIYLDSLADATEMSESKGFILQCFGEKLPSLLMLLMIGHYAASSQRRDEATEAVVSADEDAFEFVELMMLASSESRDAVLKALWSWLTSATVSELTCLGNGKLDIVIEEIENKWLENQKREKPNPSERRAALIGRQGKP